MTQIPIPIACSLPPADVARQGLEWNELSGLATATEHIDGGVAMTFGIAQTQRVEDLAAREATCCSFLSFTTTRDGDVLRLEITSRNPDALPAIEALAGVR